MNDKTDKGNDKPKRGGSLPGRRGPYRERTEPPKNPPKGKPAERKGPYKDDQYR